MYVSNNVFYSSCQFFTRTFETAGNFFTDEDNVSTESTHARPEFYVALHITVVELSSPSLRLMENMPHLDCLGQDPGSESQNTPCIGVIQCLISM